MADHVESLRQNMFIFFIISASIKRIKEEAFVRAHLFNTISKIVKTLQHGYFLQI